MNANERSRICKASTEEFLVLLHKEHKILLEQDLFKANILARILRFTPLELEEVLEYLHRYEIDIVIGKAAKKAARNALEHYDRPDWQIRGRDVFEEIYDDLKRIYEISE
ncbi:hypothetical protein [Fluviicola sp.]|uniref:hypothetical protein n=1 Tax=Fluviicola sp. TaxID=1917219 RepID=UPI0031E1F9C2